MIYFTILQYTIMQRITHYTILSHVMIGALYLVWSMKEYVHSKAFTRSYVDTMIVSDWYLYIDTIIP